MDAPQTEEDRLTQQTALPLHSIEHSGLLPGHFSPSTTTSASATGLDTSSVGSVVTAFKEKLNSPTTAATSERLSQRCKRQLNTGDSPDDANTNADTNNRNTKAQTHQTTLTTLEETATRSLPMLRELQTLLQSPNIDSTWADKAAKITALATPPKVYIAVTGNTGAGKSSLINALIDEECIPTTNCMHARTAVAIEIAYNADSAVRYRAEIEFVTPDEWERELGALMQALRAEKDAVVAEQIAHDSYAAVALDKIRAVYPHLRTVEDVLRAEMGELMGLSAVRERLGGRVVLEEDDVGVFSKKLRGYVDSRVKEEKKKVGDEKAATDEDGIWPLVRVVRVFLKSAVLATGAVLVDLPDVYDSNAGRTSVVQEYKRRCAAHWVVAPISRALDGKVARELMDDSSRMQTVFNDITFICTKTDLVSVEEVKTSLRLEESATESSPDQAAGRQARLTELRMERDILRDKQLVVNDDVEKLEAQLVKTPDEPSGKSPNKRKHSDIGLSGSATLERDAFPAVEYPPTSRRAPEQPSRQQLTARYTSVKSKQKDLNAQRKRLLQEVTTAEEELHALGEPGKQGKQGKQGKACKDTKRQCIGTHNESSRQKIKRRLIQILRETNQELDESSSLPAQDYRAAEEQLQVFCVSTRAYQWLQGRMSEDSAVEGFTTLEQTGIPQLRQHCIALTEREREKSARRFLVELNCLLQSLLVWTTPNPWTAELSEEQLRAIEVAFTRAADNLKDEWQGLRAQFKRKLREAVDMKIVDRIPEALYQGQKGFPGAVDRWNDTMRWNTYQAVCRGEGVFAQFNLNQELANLVLGRLVAAWQVVFDNTVPRLTLDLQRGLDQSLGRFHKVALASVKKVPASVDNIPASVSHRLDRIQGATAKSCAQYLRMTEEGIRNGSKDLPRQLAERIAEKLRGTYQACADQHGPGTLRRIRQIMSGTAQTRSQAVFQDSTLRLIPDLTTLQRKSETQLQTIEATFTGVVRDYHAALVAPPLQQATASQMQMQITTAVQTLVEKMETTLQLEAILTPSPPSVKKDDVEAMEDGH